MNNDLQQFSEERLKDMQKHVAAGMSLGYADALLIHRVIDIALAAKQAKPIGVFYPTAFYIKGQYKLFTIDESKHSGLIRNGILNESYSYMYTTPQPAHTEQANPVAWLLSGGGTKNIVSFDSGNAYADHSREVTPLYTTPQTRHAGLVSWIECSERMPETYLNVLLTDEADDMCIGQLESHDDTDFFVVGCPRYKATHWMPLPATPKPESE